MKMNHISWLTAFLLMLFSQFAEAGECTVVTVTSAGFSANYISGNATNVTSTTVTVTCTKLGNDSEIYEVVPDNGLNFTGTNRASFAGNFINYFLSTTSTCANTWNSANPLTFTFSTSGITQQTQTVYGCIPASQTVPIGIYTDIVTMTVWRIAKSGNSIVPTVLPIFPVSITTQAYCNLSTAPGNVAFSYTAFQSSASLANTSFGLTCNSMLPYTMSLDTAAGVVSGLNYSLGINTVSNGGSNPLGSSGTGVQQNFFINGSMPANQAGTCNTGSCTGSQLHTLTVTY